MSAFAFIRRELKNARIYFVPAGTVVDSVTVAAATWPDNNPTTNYTDFEFQDIEAVKEERNVKKESFMIPAASGGYTEDTEEMVTSRAWKATTHKTNAVLKQLQHGLASLPVATTAQAPGAKKDNSVDGIMLLVVQNKAGTVIERTQVWGRLRIVSSGDIGPESSKLEFSVEELSNALNTYVADPAA